MKRIFQAAILPLLGVDVTGAKADGGCERASLDLVSWSIGSPELGLVNWKATMHLARWADILAAPPPPEGTKTPWQRARERMGW